MRALNPDVSFVHVQIADHDGNCQIDGPTWSNEESVKAGNRVIVVTEELVPTEVIRRSPERTIIHLGRLWDGRGAEVTFDRDLFANSGHVDATQRGMVLFETSFVTNEHHGTIDATAAIPTCFTRIAPCPHATNVMSA